MSGFMFYDSFTDEFCLPSREDRIIAPPERYVPVIRGFDIYVETWMVDHPPLRRLDFAYTKEDREHGWAWVEKRRNSLARLYKCTLTQMISWTIPADVFDKYYPASD